VVDQTVPSATLMDVARLAGVSLATASRSLNGSTRQVGEDLRRRVVLAAAELNHTANAQAQAMARGRTDVVGLLVHDIADPYFSSIAAGVMRAAEDHGLLVTMASTLRRPESELDYVAALRGQRARAVVLAGSRVDDPEMLRRLGSELASFEATGGRAVMISQKKLPVDTVLLENRAGAKALAESLVGLGHRRFAVLSGPRDLLTSRDRLAGFQSGLAAAGGELDPRDVLQDSFTRDGGVSAMNRLLDQGTDATCVFAANDVMAVGAMAALRQHGIGLPGRIAVAGFDDILTLRDITPGLTTVRLPLEEVGAAAIDLVLQPRGDRPRVRRVKGQVVLRDSTPPLT
jgi:LacI family transcriptional regulator